MRSKEMIGIVSAMEPELEALLALLKDVRMQTVAGRKLHAGRLMGRDVVLVLCGIGKVAAALTSTLLIERCGVSRVIFTGVAGGLAHQARVGDVVVAAEVLQHDLDVSPLFPRYQVPEAGVSRFACDGALSRCLVQAAQSVLALEPQGLKDFGLSAPSVHEGLVVSGDRFVSTEAESRRLRAELPQALAVEMEGASLGQVCAAYGVPFAVLRTISDRADDQAHLDFQRFLTQVASGLSRDIVMQALGRLG